ncbi:hypothetical protein PTKIN_Ptkin17bG0166600 [Pterospermum kingtungense]
MESEKRKRGDDGAAEGKREKGGGDINGGESKPITEEEEEEEEEVEEFFAILKRIQVAVKYFEKANGKGRKVTGSDQWRPSFVLQDFEGDNDVKGEVKLKQKEQGLEQDWGLDLNLEPASKEDNKENSD